MISNLNQGKTRDLYIRQRNIAFTTVILKPNNSKGFNTEKSCHITVI